MKLFKKQQTENSVAQKKYNNLREVMDYTRLLSIFFSGVENDTYFKGCYDMGVRNFLMSYHYLQKSKIPLKQKYSGLGIKFFIDSGAHTYQQDPKYQDVGEDYWVEYIKRYLNWAEKNREFIFAIASCDFENLVGAELVNKWNEEYFEPFMLKTGIPVCFVWHQTSAKSWEYYCQRYPYTGFSSVNHESGENISLQEYISLLRVAEKHNTLVHGFGMTRTSLLPKLPFYTVDSTSWKSGFMYGQLAFWNNKKVQMVRKEDFERAFQYIRQYDLAPPIDEKLIYDYYEPEVLRANVFAYLKAEEFIRNSLKPLTYWQKAKANKRSEEDLSSLSFPPPEWLDLPQGKKDNLESYAKEFNVSTENLGETENIIVDITCFLNWTNPDYESFIKDVYTPELIKELHDTYINRIVENDEQRISDLISFYKANVLGENNTLLYLGTNFDRLVKEREEYITDEEYELEDIPDFEVNNILNKFLPPPAENSPAPEISDLDDEIFKENNITPVRDDKGRFVKGQKKVLKPKNLYSEKYPKMACDMCVNAQKCPEYKSGYVCAYNKMFQRYNTRDMADVIQAMQGIVSYSMQRLQRGMLTETLNGGLPDPSVTGMMNQSMSLLTQLQRMYEVGGQEVIRQTTIVRSDGSHETTTQVSNPQTGGILERIFGNMGNNTPENKDDKNMIDVSIEE